MRSTEPLAGLLARVDDALEAAGLPYVVVGPAAARLWGAGVEAGQADVVVALAPGEVEDFLAAARLGGFEVEAGLASLAAEAGEPLTIFPPGGGRFVEVRPARGAGDGLALRTRVRLPVGAGEAWVAAPEETIARLLEAGADEDLAAAREVLARQGEALDRALLRRRCEELGAGRMLRQLEAAAAPAR